MRPLMLTHVGGEEQMGREVGIMSEAVGHMVLARLETLSAVVSTISNIGTYPALLK